MTDRIPDPLDVLAWHEGRPPTGCPILLRPGAGCPAHVAVWEHDAGWRGGVWQQLTDDSLGGVPGWFVAGLVPGDEVATQGWQWVALPVHTAPHRDVWRRGVLPWSFCPLCGYKAPRGPASHAAGCPGADMPWRVTP